MEDVIIYTQGIIFCSVCAKKGLTIQEITDKVNELNPTGIGSKWQLSKEKFKGGEENPAQCNKYPDRLHYLFNC